MYNYNPNDWYYQLRSDTTKVFSTARGVFVPANDAEYQAWLALENFVSPVDTAAEIGEVLARYSVRPTDPDVLDGYLTAQVHEVVAQPSFKPLFYALQQIAELKGEDHPTVEETIEYTKSVL